MGTIAAVERPHTGRWFEELTPGLVIQHAIRRTITEADNVMFTSMFFPSGVLSYRYWCGNFEYGVRSYRSSGGWPLSDILGHSAGEVSNTSPQSRRYPIASSGFRIASRIRVGRNEFL